MDTHSNHTTEAFYSKQMKKKKKDGEKLKRKIYIYIYKEKEKAGYTYYTLGTAKYFRVSFVQFTLLFNLVSKWKRKHHRQLFWLVARIFWIQFFQQQRLWRMGSISTKLVCFSMGSFSKREISFE